MTLWILFSSTILWFSVQNTWYSNYAYYPWRPVYVMFIALHSFTSVCREVLKQTAPCAIIGGKPQSVADGKGWPEPCKAINMRAQFGWAKLAPSHIKCEQRQSANEGGGGRNFQSGKKKRFCNPTESNKNPNMFPEWPLFLLSPQSWVRNVNTAGSPHIFPDICSFHVTWTVCTSVFQFLWFMC